MLAQIVQCKKDTTFALTMSPGRNESLILTLSLSNCLTSCLLNDYCNFNSKDYNPKIQREAREKSINRIIP